MSTVRIRNLEGIDPRAVPLPNGTEVTTGIERRTVDGARVVAQGALGRVIATDEAGITVHVVGVGECRYQRDELTPHRLGQLRYAVARAAHERALAPCAVLEATVGSRAWGLAHEGSDTDRRGVFLLPYSWTIGLADAPETVVSADGSDTYWEFERAVRQGLQGDPNTLEMLWVPDARALDPVGEALLAHRDVFSSVEVYGTFGRYALSQARKLAQSARLAEHRAHALTWLRDDPDATLDTLAVKLAAHTRDEGPDGVARCRQYLKQLYRSMHDQGLLPVASFEALAVFARERSLAFELPRELRPKNAYNLVRLAASAVHWLRTGRPLIRVEGELRERLLRIKRGEVPLTQSLAWAEDFAGELDEARAHTVLPKRPDVQAADALLRAAREESARRWFARAPGPWGADAPEAPAVGHAQET